MASPGRQDFPAMRAEAKATLAKVLAPPAHPDDGMAHVNIESARAQALARLDCLCVQWLDEAFREVDRVQRWADLRAEIINRVIERHAPMRMSDATWGCKECQVPYPCPTRTDIAQNQSPKEPPR